MFVSSNVRIPVGDDNDYADMVFYCKPLRAYALIELKADRLMSSAVGQINEYLNYYAAEVNDEYDNPPIGIILCTDKNNVRAQYALAASATPCSPRPTRCGCPTRNGRKIRCAGRPRRTNGCFEGCRRFKP